MYKQLIKFLFLILIFSFEISYSQNEEVVGEIDASNEDFTLEEVEEVPIFPGCEDLSLNSEKKSCMQKKISKHISRKFDTYVIQSTCVESKIVDEKEVCVKSEYWPGFSSGRLRIYTKFKINEEGKVTEIEVRAPHERLKKEAERVLNSLPQMTPARHKEENISIQYILPISLSYTE